MDIHLRNHLIQILPTAAQLLQVNVITGGKAVNAAGKLHHGNLILLYRGCRDRQLFNVLLDRLCNRSFLPQMNVLVQLSEIRVIVRLKAAGLLRRDLSDIDGPACSVQNAVGHRLSCSAVGLI